MAVTVTLLNHVHIQHKGGTGYVKAYYVGQSGTGTLRLPNIGGEIKKVMLNVSSTLNTTITCSDADSVDVFGGTLAGKTADTTVYPSVAGSAGNTSVRIAMAGSPLLTVTFNQSSELNVSGEITIYYG